MDAVDGIGNYPADTVDLTRSKDRQDFGRFLRLRRQRRRLTQQQTADGCGISPAYLGMIERGERKPGVALLRDIVNLLLKEAGPYPDVAFVTDGGSCLVFDRPWDSGGSGTVTVVVDPPRPTRLQALRAPDAKRPPPFAEGLDEQLQERYRKIGVVVQAISQFSTESTTLLDAFYVDAARLLEDVAGFEEWADYQANLRD